MNILVIGNGFDLAHGLPTRYIDFMNYLNVIHILHTFKSVRGTFTTDTSPTTDTSLESIVDKNYIDYIIDNNSNISQVLRENILEKYHNEWAKDFPKELMNIFSKDTSKINSWYEYFCHLIKKNKLQDNWIDFEAEISKVIKKIENNIPKDVIENTDKEERCKSKNQDATNSYPSIYELMEENNNCFDSKTQQNKFILHLEHDLSDFINALDYYVTFIDEINNLKCLSDIKNIKIDKIISFNYTDTYRRCYSKNMSDENIHFIHGKANRTLGDSASKLVLGTNDTLSDQEKDSNISCVKFKKYFQRIYKRTGNDYKRFLKEADEERSGETIRSYFFGHSLAATDGDVIRRVIEASDYVVIFYHDDMQHREAITNLVTVLGRDKLIEYAEERIEFRKQRE